MGDRRLDQPLDDRPIGVLESLGLLVALVERDGAARDERRRGRVAGGADEPRRGGLERRTRGVGDEIVSGRPETDGDDDRASGAVRRNRQGLTIGVIAPTLPRYLSGGPELVATS
jgi:hypothetical protein